MNKQNSLSMMLVLALVNFCMLSCKKDKDMPENSTPSSTVRAYDTIFPLSYFPAFPGSYWKYTDAHNDTTLIKTEATYQQDYFMVQEAAYLSDTFYVPIYNHIPIWRYEAHTGPISHSGSYPLSMILSDTLPIGSSWVISSGFGRQISRKVIAKDTTILIATKTYYPTIVVEEFYSLGPLNYTWIAKRYYTKNIGLIREDTYNATDSTVDIKQLVDYFINK